MIEAIKEIPGEDGWRKSSGEEQFADIAIMLVDDYNMREDDATNLLDKIYWIVAGEFGS